MFLFAHQGDKVIVFASNCELVNLLHKIMKELDWNNCVNKRRTDDTNQSGDVTKKENEPFKLFGGANIFKLHGNMEHAERK